MINPSGNVVVNGITDVELVKILEIKIRHEGKFTFNPQQLQPNQVNVGGKVQSIYNNAVFAWQNEQGLAAVHEVLSYLLKKEERQEAVGH